MVKTQTTTNLVEETVSVPSGSGTATTTTTNVEETVRPVSSFVEETAGPSTTTTSTTTNVRNSPFSTKKTTTTTTNERDIYHGDAHGEHHTHVYGVDGYGYGGRERYNHGKYDFRDDRSNYWRNTQAYNEYYNSTDHGYCPFFMNRREISDLWHHKGWYSKTGEPLPPRTTTTTTTRTTTTTSRP